MYVLTGCLLLAEQRCRLPRQGDRKWNFVHGRGRADLLENKLRISKHIKYDIR